MSDCIFCKIVAGQIPSTKVYEDEQVLAFEDVSPKAPVHTLVIPKKHLVSTNDLSTADTALAGHLLLVAREVARLKGVESSGYRIVTNAGKDSGQVVFHMHLHVMGGKPLGPFG